MFSSRRVTTLGGPKFQDNYSFEFNLDATNHYIQTSSTYQSVFRGSWSIVAWIKPADAQVSYTQVIFGGSNTDSEDKFYVSLDEDDTVLGSLDAAVSGADSVLDGILGIISITNYADMINGQVATKNNIGLILKGASSSKSIYVGGVIREAGTARGINDIDIRLGIVKD